ncbi:nuclear transport factor 2 family protein [Streptomyces sp. DSM 44915]|uniref:Nuclear transport factor 2 family protein n=1 Tax=Streptomyces chisholmiae TaxID=3075540 RepID=A0ABU2JX09_9ACTN|nr:nuclear transport factor 2 family protein [Streptomyces sp. DSM 44915]MDT0269532.1 nuclear transport factor 2 family protein [Streptomyces sp. DSM 44915]
MTGARTDIEAVEAANTALYEAIERGDLAALTERWLADDISVVHPGWPVINGRAEVLRSYALIMANTDYIQFFLTDVEVSVLGDTALVTCTENILSGGPAETEGEVGPLVGGLVVATNVFRRAEDGQWLVWSHHGSPVLIDRDDEPTEDRHDTARPGATGFDATGPGGTGLDTAGGDAPDGDEDGEGPTPV